MPCCCWCAVWARSDKAPTSAPAPSTSDSACGGSNAAAAGAAACGRWSWPSDGSSQATTPLRPITRQTSSSSSHPALDAACQLQPAGPCGCRRCGGTCHFLVARVGGPSPFFSSFFAFASARLASLACRVHSRLGVEYRGVGAQQSASFGRGNGLCEASGGAAGEKGGRRAGVAYLAALGRVHHRLAGRLRLKLFFGLGRHCKAADGRPSSYVGHGARRGAVTA